MTPTLLLCLALQSPIGDEAIDTAIEAKLRSDDPAQAAWGSSLAATHGRDDLAPAIVEHLLAASGTYRVAMEKVCLDALWRLEVLVEPTVLRAVHDRQGPVSSRTELVLLASRDVTANRGLLFAILDHPDTHGKSWWAAARLLASVRADGLATRLLDEARLELHVTLVDDLETGSGISGGMTGAVGYVTRRPESFPPAAKHRFVVRGGRDARLVLSGAGDLDFQTVRTETRRSSYPPPSTHVGARAPHVLACLSHLADEDHPPEASDSILIARGDGQETEIGAAVRAREDALRGLVAALVGRGQLTPADAEAFVPIVEVHRHEQHEQRDG